MTGSPEDLEGRIRAAILRALGPDPARGGVLAMGATPGWDSMGHMAIVLELEREFGVRFPAFRLPQLADVPSIARLLREETHGAVEGARTIAQQPNLPSPFTDDPHPLLERAGELVRFGPGRYGLGPRLTALVRALDDRVRRIAARFESAEWTFPSLIGADALDRCRYFRNFPAALTLVAHLRADPAALQQFASTSRCEGNGLTVDVSSLGAIECLLAPAVCFHWYASLAGSKLQGARTITAAGKCFRYESTNLTGLERLWDFTMREIVFVGTREYVLAQREACIRAGAALMDELGLAYEISAATDPFFVDAYAAQAAYQQGFELKFELLVPLPYAGRRIAVGSFNYHQDFFGRSFAIDVDGVSAHTGCAGFGLERLALALTAQYGVDERKWPAAVEALIAGAHDV